MQPLKITAALHYFLIHHEANTEMAENIKHTGTAQFCGFTAARVWAAGGSASERMSSVEPQHGLSLHSIQSRLGCAGVFT